jgi:hypothetical protein
MDSLSALLPETKLMDSLSALLPVTKLMDSLPALSPETKYRNVSVCKASAQWYNHFIETTSCG